MRQLYGSFLAILIAMCSAACDDLVPNTGEILQYQYSLIIGGDSYRHYLYLDKDEHELCELAEFIEHYVDTVSYKVPVASITVITSRQSIKSRSDAENYSADIDDEVYAFVGYDKPGESQWLHDIVKSYPGEQMVSYEFDTSRAGSYCQHWRRVW